MTTIRVLFKKPGYLLACLVVLGLGIGGNAAIFSLIYSVIFAPLPYPDVDRLVFVWERVPTLPDPIGPRLPVRRSNFVEWQRQTALFTGMAAFTRQDLRENGAERPQLIPVGFASASLFPMLGVRPETGRLFRDDEERAGSDLVAVLSDSYFERRFQRSGAAVGTAIDIGGTSYTVIGVLPRRFHLPGTYEGEQQPKADVWVPLSRRWKALADDLADTLNVMAKLRPGITIDRARIDMGALADRLAKADEERHGPGDVSVFSMRDEDTSPGVNRALYVLWGAVGFLLLIGCANLANLTLARSMVRTREIAVRRALGASRARIIRQLFGESFVVSLLGAGAGVLVAEAAIRAILALHPPGVQRPEQVGLNVTVFAFVAAASGITAVLFGVAPAIAASRTGVNDALKAGASQGASARRSRGRQVLIAGEVAMALVLVSGAGLLIRSFQKVLATDLGYEAARLLSADVDLPENRYPDAQARARFFDSLRERARVLPGVVDATVADALPMHRLTFHNFSIVGQPEPDRKSPPIADFANVGADYFRTFGVPLVAGRDFSGAEVASAVPVAIVNRSFARKFLGSRDPIGQQIRDQDRVVPIVGVAADYRQMGAEGDLRPQVFRPSVQSPGGLLIVRLAGAAAPTAQAVRALVASMDREIAAGQMHTLEEWNDEFLAGRRFSTLLLTIFAGLALVLALVGVYAVMANLVAARTREIGIRMAVGASPAGIGRMVAVQTLRPVVAGLIAGMAGSLAISRVLESMLFQVSARDPVTMTLAVVLMMGVAPAALYVPLRRAMRVSCSVALRDE
ncbi:MAG: hypothetical protein C5B57_05065 [Blastocatellia bacterium]|nr:MAG: hypothetical protein C5B57_05065 [Blastocatellia bacterium]